MRGRKPKPTRLKLLTGNPGKRRLNKNEPKPSSIDPLTIKPPDFLFASARSHWFRMLPILHNLGILTEIDTFAFAAYCQSCAIYEDAMRRIKKMGQTIIGSRGTLITNPYVRIARNALEEIFKFASEFGVMPASRARLTIPPPGENDPFDEFLRAEK